MFMEILKFAIDDFLRLHQHHTGISNNRSATNFSCYSLEEISSDAIALHLTLLCLASLCRRFPQICYVCCSFVSLPPTSFCLHGSRDTHIFFILFSQKKKTTMFSFDLKIEIRAKCGYTQYV